MDPKDYTTCPYDKSHYILNTRMQYHLTRCRRNHPDVHLEKCPFNSTHLLTKEKFSEHVLTCPQRELFENYRHRTEPTQGKPAFLDPPPFEEVPSTESWDDIDVPTYNPKTYVENAPVLRLMKGGTPSERKQFREEERKRLLELRKRMGDDKQDDK